MSGKLVKQVADLCSKKIVFSNSSLAGENSYVRTLPVHNFILPNEMEKVLEGDLKLNENGCTEKEFIALCSKFMDMSVNTWHPGFMTQLISGIDEFSLSASWILESLNAASYTYETGPVFSVIQRHVVTRVLNMLGMPAENSDGVFCPGASIGNMYGMMWARQRLYPQSRFEGLQNLPRLAIFTSDISHYSIEKGAILQGYGLNSVVKVEADERGVMRPEKLREAIQTAISKGVVPLMVNATAGSTMIGSFDDCNAIADVCEEFKDHKIWLHCDAAFGGSAIFSENTKHLLAGVERFDSVTLDFHKIAGALLQCSIVVSKHASIVKDSISVCAAYLFQSDKGYDVAYDAGDKSIQCSQKADAFKFWLLLKAKGLGGMAREIDGLMDMSRFTQAKLQETEGFYMVMPEFQYVNILFWYVPKALRNVHKTPVSHPLIGKVAPKVRNILRDSNKYMISCSTHHDLPSYFRIICTNRLVDKDYMLWIIDLIRNTAESLTIEDLKA